MERARIAKSIPSTLAYYDVLEMPLTAFEVWRYLAKGDKSDEGNSLEFLGTPLTLNALIKTLDQLKDERKISERWGYYFLQGRDALVDERIRRMKIAEEKWKKAQRAIVWLQCIPYVRAVFGSGSLGMNNTKEESDLDVLVVTKAGRIWTARFFVTVLLSLLHKRRHGRCIKDKICLNHYITDQSLEIPFRGLYNAQTYAHLVPVLSNGISLESFYLANAWMEQYLVHAASFSKELHQRILPVNQLLRFFAKAAEWIFDSPLGEAIERLLRSAQKAKIARNPETYATPGRVTANDEMLEFHPDSPEQEILDKYQKNMLQWKLLDERSV